MDTINWKIGGMTCSNCVLTIRQYLEKQGAGEIRISMASGDLSFAGKEGLDLPKIRKGIGGLGYTVEDADKAGAGTGKRGMNRYLRYTLISLPLTLLLFMPMLLPMFGGPLHFLMEPRVQMGLALPVYGLGMVVFGRSAWRSLRSGLPNMNVLVSLGATAAFFYSLAGTVMGWGMAYQFYETAASIITLVFFGNYLEDASIKSTQRALDGLVRQQKTMANMIAFDGDHQEVIFPMENDQLKSGDLVLIRTGEQVPADCKILWGEASVDESILTGESLPLEKGPKEVLAGGSMLVGGTVRAQVTADSSHSVLSGIIRLIRQAQGEKPPIQHLADRISAIFVPVVLGLALLTGLLNYVFLHDGTAALMRSVAVLVIACPCAMGLATPAAMAVGLGRAARKGMLFRHAAGLESFKDIRQVVFDKTGTLTKGAFRIDRWEVVGNAAMAGEGVKGGSDAAAGVMEEKSGGVGEVERIGARRAMAGVERGEEGAQGEGVGRDAPTEEEFKRIAYSLAKYSNHPVSRSIAAAWKQKGEERWRKVEEVKGMGMRGETKTGDVFWMGSHKVMGADFLAGTVGANEDTHNSYILCNDTLWGWIDLSDELRPEAEEVVRYFTRKGIRTILLSGDRPSACIPLAKRLGMDEVYAGQSPQQKLEKIGELAAKAPVAMVGDGINDAPALAKATVGISLSDASQLAMQTADLVLVNQGLKNLPMALFLGKETYRTIRQNLFWAFFYNIVAIPIAATGLLSPTVAALVMGLSDVVLAVNSVRLFVKRPDGGVPEGFQAPEAAEVPGLA